LLVKTPPTQDLGTWFTINVISTHSLLLQANQGVNCCLYPCPQRWQTQLNLNNI
jgi:hypothetical protein